MKAYEVRDPDEMSAAVVFAETRGKAKVLAQRTDACEDLDFTEIDCRRFKEADSMYEPGKWMLDWNILEDRLFLVRHGWYCLEVNEKFCCPEQCPVWADCEKGGGDDLFKRWKVER